FLHHVVSELAADEALDRSYGVRRIGDGLALGGLSDQHLAILGEGNDGRRGAITLAVLDDFGLAALHDRDARIRRTEIDTNHFTHCENPLKIKSCDLTWGHAAYFSIGVPAGLIAFPAGCLADHYSGRAQQPPVQ